ncbi:unnamed protein product [Trichobilharzia regenti]|nr:unnamed protein product [Trichobilharzia regenti]
MMNTRSPDPINQHQADRTINMFYNGGLQGYALNPVNTNRIHFNLNPFTTMDSSFLTYPQSDRNTLLLSSGQFYPNTIPYRFPVNLNSELSQHQQQYFNSHPLTDQNMWNPVLAYLAAATQFILNYHSSIEQRQWQYSQTQSLNSHTEPSCSSNVSAVNNQIITRLQLLQSQSNDNSPQLSSESSTHEHSIIKENINNVNKKNDANHSNRVKRYQCTFPGCSKAYYKRSHLNEHFHLHTGLKPHLCNQPGCGARFTRADQLSRHRRAHTGERNFFCHICSKRFKRSDHLKVHLARNVCRKPTS